MEAVSYKWWFRTELMRRRRERNYRQTDLAEMVGAHRNTIYKIEKGTVLPNFVMAAKLAMAVGMDLNPPNHVALTLDD